MTRSLRREWGCTLLALTLLTLPAHASTTPGGNGDTGKVTLAHHGENYDFDNGNVKVTLNGPTATITDFRYHGTDFINQVGKHEAIYWSMDGGASYQNPAHATCTVKTDTPDMADVGCKVKYDGSQPHAFDIDIHYVLRRGNTGLYVYAILSHPASYPETSVGEWRIVWQTPQVGDKFLLEKIYVDKLRHWVYPTPAEYAQEIHTPIKEISFMRSGPWANKGESKYTYSATYEDIGTFGFASDVHKLGAWTVLGSFEYYNDGPRKQDLTALAGGMTHHFGRNHYGDTGIHVAAGEEWSKLFGPFLLYLNSGADGDTLWHDAQQQSATEQAAWPYAWLTGLPQYPSAAERGSASGKFFVADKLKPTQTGAKAWIGLTQPPPGLDFQSETKNYQYWSRVAPDGTFHIPNARPGTYTLYAFVDGETGVYKQENVTVAAGKDTPLGDVTWTVPRLGNWLAFEIGTPDRDTTEFRHGQDYFMPYLYKGFPLEFPNPLVYTVGSSNPARDWNYAQSSYHPVGKDPQPWPWQIKFNLPADLPKTGNANLVLAFAGAGHRAHVQVNVNGTETGSATPEIEEANSLLRQGSHDKYSVSNIAVPMERLHPGSNTIELIETNYKPDDAYVMYDYITLEMPGTPPAKR
jgi:rhamnogalacturonan endolyase